MTDRRDREAIDPWVPLGVEFEQERTEDGSIETMTVFLAGAECPFPCVFCDLWRHTTVDPTPTGALPSQLSIANARHEGMGLRRERTQIKLYNASNLFEERAVPSSDDDVLIELLSGYRRVTAECHPRLIGERAQYWCEELLRRGSRLEVAMGFETAHPEVFPKLGKKATLRDLEQASARLLDMGASVRAFLLVGVPFLEASQQAEWVARSVAFAADCGASVISLIPLRPSGNTVALRPFEAPTIELVESSLQLSVEALRTRPRPPVLLVDLWDVERLEGEGVDSLRRLESYNRSGVLEAVSREEPLE